MAAFEYGFNFDNKTCCLSRNNVTPTPNWMASIGDAELMKCIEPSDEILGVSKIDLSHVGSQSKVKVKGSLEIMYVSEKQIGSVIGFSGSNISHIRKISKAKIDIKNKPNKHNNRQIIITGTETQIKNAKENILALVNKKVSRKRKHNDTPIIFVSI
jgi:hypothetical protein